MAEVVIYASRYCSYCVRTRRLLKAKGVACREILVDGDIDSRRQMEQRTGRRTVPQVYIGDRHVGGFDSLLALDATGELDRLLFGDAVAGCA